MIDADLIRECADPRLSVAIVEKFVEEVAQPDALYLSVTKGAKHFAVPKPKTPQEAMKITKEYLGYAVVRAGLTQYPAGIGIQDPDELSMSLFDPCENLRLGTAMFSKVYRITTEHYGRPTEKAFDDAIASYASGRFEGKDIFYAADPGNVSVWEPVTEEQLKAAAARMGEEDQDEDESDPIADVMAAAPGEGEEVTRDPSFVEDKDPNKASMRIDLSGIKSHNVEIKGAGE